MALSTQPYKGTRDFFPEDMSFRNWMFTQIRKTTESYGYHEYDGPMLEPFDIYAAKTGEEIVNQQLYHFKDRGERKVAMRPEMTPTMARMVASRVQQLAKPIRWFSIPNLWRYERPQRGRLREHWQLNIDLLGGENRLADVEILQLAFDLIDQLGGGDKIKIHINNRKLVNFVFNEKLKLNAEQALKAGKAIDARDKIGNEAYLKLLNEAGISGHQSQDLEVFFKSTIDDVIKHYPCEGADELKAIFEHLKDTPVFSALQFDPKIMRGLDYYTGTVFEVFDISPENNRAMFGGGRYDDLIGLYGKTQLSGVGFGMGDVTLQNFLETHNLVAKDILPDTDVFIVLPDSKDFIIMNKLAQILRANDIKVSTPLSSGKFAAQFKLANKLNAKFAVILGEHEISTKIAGVKNLTTGKQTEVAFSELSDYIKNQL